MTQPTNITRAVQRAFALVELGRSLGPEGVFGGETAGRLAQLADLPIDETRTELLRLQQEGQACSLVMRLPLSGTNGRARATFWTRKRV